MIQRFNLPCAEVGFGVKSTVTCTARVGLSWALGRRIIIHPFDIAITALVWFTFSAISLGWLYFSSQTAVPRSYRNSAAILARLTAVIALPFIVFCLWLSLPVAVLAGMYVVILVLSPFATFHDISPDQPLLLPLLLPLYVVKQFILGFPDRQLVILSAPANATATSDLLHLKDALGKVVATLRPCGMVQINGADFSATTDDGQYLDQGTAIRVVGIRNALLVVMATDSSQLNSA